MTDHAAVEGREPREVPPKGRSSIWIWATVLVGPVTWITHFMVVYLAAEVICTQGTGRQPLISSTALGALILGATAVALAVVSLGAVLTWRRGTRRAGVGEGGEGTDGAPLRFAGLLLSIGSVMAILFVGLPVIWLRPC